MEEKEFVENFLIIRINYINYVKVLFEEEFPNGWTGYQTQNHIIEILQILFDDNDFDVGLYARYKNKEGK